MTVEHWGDAEREIVERRRRSGRRRGRRRGQGRPDPAVPRGRTLDRSSRSRPAWSRQGRIRSRPHSGSCARRRASRPTVGARARSSTRRPASAASASTSSSPTASRRATPIPRAASSIETERWTADEVGRPPHRDRGREDARRAPALPPRALLRHADAPARAVSFPRHACRRRQGDQAGRVPRRADAGRRARARASAATRCSSRRAPAPAARSPTPTTTPSAPGSARSTRSGRRPTCCSRSRSRSRPSTSVSARGSSSSRTSTSPRTSRSRARSSRAASRRSRTRRSRRTTAQLPLLAPMSEVAGRLAAQAGAYFLEKPLGGRGLLLGGVRRRRPRPGRRDRRRDGRLQRGDHRARPRRAGADPRPLGRPPPLPRGDPRPAASSSSCRARSRSRSRCSRPTS